MRQENLRRGLELKKAMNNILDGFNIGVIKVTPLEDASNKVSFCNQLCFKMLKSFITQYQPSLPVLDLDTRDQFIST